MREHNVDDVLTRISDTGLHPEAQRDAEQRLLDRWETRNAAGDRRAGSNVWRRGRLPLLAAAATLTLAGASYAAETLLNSGAPVPPATAQRFSYGTIEPGTSRVLDLGTRDPDGGPGWAMLLYGLELPGATTPAGERIPARRLTCVAPGRTQNGEIGIVGRDGAFDDDGRFHALTPDSRPTGSCGRARSDGAVFSDDFGPTIPASGYTGRVPSRIGACRERTGDAPSMSESTSRRLRDIPVCSAAGQRIVKFGFAGPRATRITFGNDRFTETAIPKPELSGAYMFVVLPDRAGLRPPVLTVTYDNGLACRSSLGSRTSDKACLSPPGLGLTDGR
ncbi:hypothetical protein AB0L40_06945 [Patulibacter sp. NPDC049589]|uniref:hypothetical protein n=1 Tax=Patulibacter sp. NPDC049589 TaxID=3154731 RepID=UPI003435A99C